MESLKELLEKLNNDKEFLAKFNETATAKAEGTKNADSYELIAATAADFGYAVDREEWDAFVASKNEVLSEEELGKVSGGVTPVISWVTVVTYTTEMATMLSVAITDANSW